MAVLGPPSRGEMVPGTLEGARHRSESGTRIESAFGLRERSGMTPERTRLSE